jgi:putative tricarboxylic transport membrane protein
MTSQTPGDRARTTRSGPIKSPIDFAGGVFLLGLAATGLIGGYTLPFGTLSGIGSGLLPRVVALLVGAFGILVLVQSFFAEGQGLDRWATRGIIFVLGAVLVFAAAVRPLGLVVAGPLAVMVSAFADKDSRPVEVVIFGVVMTMLAGLLFKELLNLPIPFDPAGIIPDVVNSFYVAVKAQIGAFFTTIKNLLAR